MAKKRAGEKRATVTFQPDKDVEQWLAEADKRGRGVRTKVINRALRDCIQSVISQWDNWQKAPSSFNHADPREGSLPSAA